MPECVMRQPRGSERVLSLEDIFFSHEFGRARGRGLTTVVTAADDAVSGVETSLGSMLPALSSAIGSVPASSLTPG